MTQVSLIRVLSLVLAALAGPSFCLSLACFDEPDWRKMHRRAVGQ